MVTRRVSEGCKAKANPANEPARNAGEIALVRFWSENIRNNVRYNEIVTDVAKAVWNDLLFFRFAKIAFRLELMKQVNRDTHVSL